MRWRRVLPIVVFAATTVAFMPGALLGEGTYVGVDLLEQTAPYRDAIGRPPDVVSITQGDQVEVVPPGVVGFTRELRHGHWQRWEPRIGAGMPGGISPLNGILSPFAWPYLVLPAWFAIGLRIALSLLFAQVFGYLFFRRLAVSRWAATIGAVAYAYTGTNIVLIHRVTAVFVLPALLWAVHRVATAHVSSGRRWRDVAILAGLVAWTWFEGFPAGFVYCVYAATAWAVAIVGARWWRERGDPDRRDVALRRGALRLGAVGAALVWGVALAGVTLVPLVSEVTTRGILEAREFAHLPDLNMFGLLTYEVPGPPLGDSFWASQTPVEATAAVGMVVVVGAAIALLLASFRRVWLRPDQRTAWGFAAFVLPVVLLLSYADTPLSRVAERLPGLANNPVWRSRFLIAMAAVILLVLLVDALWRSSRPATREAAGEERGEDALAPAPVWMSRVSLLLVGGAALRFLPRLVDAARNEQVLDDIARDVVENLDLAAVAIALVVLGMLRRKLVPLCAVAITAIVFWQVAWPVRDFTPTAPRDDFYTTQSGHRAMKRLTEGAYRYSASNLNFYADQSVITGVYDVRGAGLHAPRFRHLIEQAVPDAYEADPFKVFFGRDGWKKSSPALDHLSVRYFALGTDDLPYGEPVMTDDFFDGWHDAAQASELDPVRVPGGFDAIHLPIRGRGECDRGHVVVEALVGGERIARTSRPLHDVSGVWLSFAIKAAQVDPQSDVSLRVHPTDARCRLEIGVTDGAKRPAVALYALPERSPLRLASTDQAWIYERATAEPIVTAYSQWREVPNQRAALRYLRDEPDLAREVVGVVGASPPSPNGPAQSAPDLRPAIGVNDVRVRVDTDARTLVSLGQTASAGWHVKVDGDDAPIVRIDGALLGVFVPRGTHEIVAVYRPTSFDIGAGLSALALLVGAGSGAVWFVRTRRRRT